VTKRKKGKRVHPRPTDKNQVRRGPLGDAIDIETDADLHTRPSLPPEKVEDRPNVGEVTPEDYPKDKRARIEPPDD